VSGTSWSPIEVFCFGVAAIMAVGWTVALFVDWDLNIDDVPRTLLIIAALLGVGFYRRRKRINRLNSRVRF
jgi:hypothetical protein